MLTRDRAATPDQTSTRAGPAAPLWPAYDRRAGSRQHGPTTSSRTFRRRARTTPTSARSREQVSPGGCGPGLYCPTQTVQRRPDGSFIARTLRASTPLGRTAMGRVRSTRMQARSPVRRERSRPPSPTTVAYVSGHVSLRQAVAGELGYSVQPVISTDGGATSGVPTIVSYSTSVTSGGWSNASQSIVVNLGVLGVNPPTRIGMRVARESGTVDASDSRCRIQAQVTYSDAGPPPWGP